MAQAVSRSKGNDSRIKSEYLKLRLQSLKDEMEVRSELDAEQERRQVAEEESVVNEELETQTARIGKALAGLRELGCEANS